MMIPKRRLLTLIFACLSNELKEENVTNGRKMHIREKACTQKVMFFTAQHSMLCPAMGVRNGPISYYDQLT